MVNVKVILILAAAITAASAVPAPGSTTDNCQNYTGDCFGNDCNGSFGSPTDTQGTCTTGKYNGCACEKCGSGTGYVGACDANGCAGVRGTCSAGQYQGCPCK